MSLISTPNVKLHLNHLLVHISGYAYSVAIVCRSYLVTTPKTELQPSAHIVFSHEDAVEIVFECSSQSNITEEVL